MLLEALVVVGFSLPGKTRLVSEVGEGSGRGSFQGPLPEPGTSSLPRQLNLVPLAILSSLMTSVFHSGPKGQGLKPHPAVTPGSAWPPPQS